MLQRLLAASVSELDVRLPVVVSPSATVADTIQALRKARRGAALIVDARGTLVGIFTERDLLERLDPADLDLSAFVVEVMTPDPITLQADATVATALSAMSDGALRHLPVMGPQGRVLGMLSVRDILTWVSLHFPETVQNLPPEPVRGASRRWGG